MKKLRNDFTTTAQSKRLLKLGVPIDTANCYVRGKSRVYEVPDGFTYTEWASKTPERDCTPVWSVGRLLEIVFITYIYRKTERFVFDPMEIVTPSYMVEMIKDGVAQELLDFSKL